MEIYKIFSKISETPFLTAIRKGLTAMMPLMIIGAFAILVDNFPLMAYQNLMTDVFGEHWKEFLSRITSGTFGVMSIGMLLSISSALAENRKEKVSRSLVMLTAFGSFIILSGVENGIELKKIGSQGVFISVAVAIISSSLFYFLYNHRIFKMKQMQCELDGSLFNNAVAAIEPAAETLIIFSIFSAILKFCGIGNLHEAFYSFLNSLFSGVTNGLGAAFLFVFATHFLWIFGIHGNNALETVAQDVFSSKLDTNINAVATGAVPTEIFTKQFFDCFILMGGAGSTICLIIAIFIKARKSSDAQIAKFSIPLGIFNINETLTFGLPIILNPFYVIPFVLVPIAQLIISYAAFASGLVPMITNSVDWTTPVFFSGYIATESVWGIVLQIVNIIAGTAIYIPFAAMSQTAKNLRNMKVVNQLNAEVNYVETHRVSVLINRADEVGSLARTLATDAVRALKDPNNKEFFMVFQPQVGNDGKTVGCETLLRYKNEKFGFIPPPTIITIAEEADFDDLLTEFVFNEALNAEKVFLDKGFKDLVISINLSPVQLKNAKIYDILKSKIETLSLDPDKIEVELTENIDMGDEHEISGIFEKYKALGIRMAIDDFGMGHTSLAYIQQYNFDTIKLDGFLVERVADDKQTQSVIGTIMKMSHELNMHVIAEVVETQEQKAKLQELGCSIYQGYLYSKPLVFEDFIDYAK